jgi:UDP-N-acetylglucosamine transferase subunit ALG13
MIFLAVGTQEPFDRMVRAVDEWCANGGAIPVFGQISARAGYLPRHFESVPSLPPEEFRHRAATADLIISHAGMGSIITAATVGRPILLLPRLASLGEHRNEHQLATAARFEGRNGIHVAKDEVDLVACLESLVRNPEQSSGDTISPFAMPELIAALRAFGFKAKS